MKLLAHTLFFFLLATEFCYGQWVDQNTRTTNTVEPDWVRYYYTNDLSPNDEYSTIVSDSEGNVYVGGSTEIAFPLKRAMLLAKYNASGSRQWLVSDTSDIGVRHLDVDSSGHLIVNGHKMLMKYTLTGMKLWAITIEYTDWYTLQDQNGNIYVQNAPIFVHGSGEFVKYNPEGTKLWSIDTAGIAAVDIQGNIYMALDGNVVLKYDSSGAKLWEDKYAVYSGGKVFSISVTDSEITIVGAYSPPETSPVLVALRYSTNGERKWIWEWEKAPPSLPGWFVDPDGSLYVFGVNFYERTTTLQKVGNDGITRWARTDIGYGGRSIDLDEKGNIIITWMEKYGDCPEDPGEFWVTAKYDAGGVLLWRTYSNGRVCNIWEPTVIDVNPEGKIFVMGMINNEFSKIIQYSSNGRVNWELDLDCSYGFVFDYEIDPFAKKAHTIDPTGNLYLVGDLDRKHPNDAVLAKVREDGEIDWVATYDGPKMPGESSAGSGIDSSGNIYHLSDKGDKTRAGFGIVKYDPNGDQLWVKEGNCSSRPCMTVAKDGSVFLVRITSSTEGNVTREILWLDKVSPVGDILWSIDYHPADNVHLSANSIMIDQVGSIYVVAGRYGPNDSLPILINKHAVSGDILWSTDLSSIQTSSYRYFTAGAIDQNGNILISGSGGWGYAGSIVKLNANGGIVWHKSLFPRIMALTTDDNGLVYLVGHPKWGDELTVIAKYDSMGNELWLREETKYNIIESEIVVDKNGSIFLSGAGLPKDSTGIYCITVSYDSSGQNRWMDLQPQFFRRGGMMFGPSAPAPAMTIDRNGYLYVTRSENGLATIKYSDNGDQLWSSQFNKPYWASECFPTRLEYDQLRGLFVTGSILSAENGACGVLVTLLYNVGTTASRDSLLSGPSTYILEQNHPNPFNPSTTIKYELPRSAHVTLNVYDVLGREIATLVNEGRDAGHHEVTFDALHLSSGVYLYQLRAGDYVSVKKMLLVR